MNNEPTSPLHAFVGRASTYLFTMATLCYLAGFVITNLFLGSLGVVSLDVFKARYILSGTLFLLFLGAIAYLVLGLIRTRKKYLDQPMWRLLPRALWYSVENLFVLYMCVGAIGLLAGSASFFTGGAPTRLPAIAWDSWLSTEPQKGFRSAAVLMSLAACLGLIAVLIVIAINPKTNEGIRRSRSAIIAQIFSELKKGWWKSLMSVAIFYVGWSILMDLPSLLNLLTTNHVGVVASPNVAFLVQGPWVRFFAAISVLYALIGLILLIMLSVPGDRSEFISGNPLTPYGSWIYLIALVVLLVVHVYSIGIYPCMPQQVGGGEPVPVEVLTSTKEAEAVLHQAGNQIFLVDRGQSHSLFLVDAGAGQRQQIVELPNRLIDGILFDSLP